MAKMKNNMQMVIVGLVVLIIGWLVYRNRGTGMARTNGTNGGTTTGSNASGLEPGCFPLEEVHESGTEGEMWVCIIPFWASGEAGVRPKGDALDRGSQIQIKGTGSALDGVYTVRSIYYDDRGDIGCVRVDIPGGYNFNYNATQGGEPRDMTYFGIGRVCIIDGISN